MPDAMNSLEARNGDDIGPSYPTDHMIITAGESYGIEDVIL
jgi:hypothetical protein